MARRPTSPVMTGPARPLVGALLALSVGLAVPAAAQSGTAVWHDLTVPGGAAGVSHAVELATEVDRTRLLLELARVFHARPEDDEVGKAALEPLEHYVDTVARFRQALAAVSSDGTIHLGLAENSQLRKRLEELLELVDFRLRRRDNVYRVEARSNDEAAARRARLELAGVSFEGFAERLNAGERVTLALPTDRAPLPLSPAAWNAIAFDGRVRPEDLFGAIARDRRAAHLYHGLAALDDETLRYLDGNRDLLGRLYRDHAAALAAFGRSLRIRNGRVELPGGEAARPLWEELIDNPAGDPERVIRRILGRDGGRLALFYDTVAHLDEPRRRFAFGAWIADPRERADRFRKFYSEFAGATDGWSGDRPFQRPLVGPALLLMQIRTAPDGTPAAPAWLRLWEVAFDGDDLVDDPEDALRRLRDTELVDGAWLAEQVSHVRSRYVRRDRLEMFLFAQRVFNEAEPADAPLILTALRGFVRYRTLMLTLERLGIRTPTTYAAAAQRARQLTSVGDRARRAISLAQFQAGLALVVRARAVRTLDVAQALVLANTLIEVPLDADGGYHGGVARWVHDLMLPRLAQATGQTGDGTNADALLISTLAGVGAVTGRSSPSAGAARVADRTYLINIVQAEVQRLWRIREQQASIGLQDTMTYWRAVTALRDAPRAVEQIGPARRALEAILPRVWVARPPGLSIEESYSYELDRRAERTLRDLSRIDRPGDLDDLDDVVDDLSVMADAFLADVMASYVYAAHIADPDAAILFGANVAQRHDFGLDDSQNENQRRTPWTLAHAIADQDARWHARGSLLGLDAGLPRLSLRHAEEIRQAGAPVVTGPPRAALAQSVALLNLAALRDVDLKETAATVERGRQRVGRLLDDPSQLDALAAAVHLSATRHRLLPWVIANAPDQIATWFSLIEMLRLGEPSASLLSSLDALAMPSTPLDGCLCAAFPTAASWENFSGRHGSGQLMTRVGDIHLRVAELLAEAEMPAVLARSVIQMAMQDYVDRVRPVHPDDWLTLVQSAQQLDREQFEGYVQSLVTTGLFTAAADPAATAVDGGSDAEAGLRAPMFSARVRAVALPVVVTDGGRFVKGLKREDFRVFEDSVQQTLTLFEADNIPLDLTVALDISGSMTETLPQVKAAAQTFLRALPGNAEVTVVGFNHETFTLVRRSTDPTEGLAAVQGLEPWGGTALYDAVVRSVRGLDSHIGRKAIVLFTDGADRFSHVQREEAERQVQLSGATIYAIGFGDALDGGDERDSLERMSRSSGGRGFFTGRLRELSDRFDEILEDLSNQYLLVYEPSNTELDGGYRGIRVEVAGQRYRIRTREGYFAVPDSAGR